MGEEDGGYAHIVHAHKADAPMREAMAIKRPRLEAKRVRRPGVQPSGGPSKNGVQHKRQGIGAVTPG